RPTARGPGQGGTRCGYQRRCADSRGAGAAARRKVPRVLGSREEKGRCAYSQVRGSPEESQGPAGRKTLARLRPRIAALATPPLAYCLAMMGSWRVCAASIAVLWVTPIAVARLAQEQGPAKW